MSSRNSHRLLIVAASARTLAVGGVRLSRSSDSEVPVAPGIRASITAPADESAGPSLLSARLTSLSISLWNPLHWFRTFRTQTGAENSNKLVDPSVESAIRRMRRRPAATSPASELVSSRRTSCFTDSVKVDTVSTKHPKRSGSIFSASATWSTSREATRRWT